MKRQLALAFFIFPLAVRVLAAPAQMDAMAWLERMQQSHRQLSYHGIVTYQLGDSLRSFNVSHVVKNGREFESLEPLDGPESTLQQHHELSCKHVGSQLLSRSKLPGYGGVQQFYQLTLQGESRQAGRKVVELFIQPRDSFRYGYRFFLDAETGLLLRNDILAQGGEPLERFQFVTLNVNDRGEEHAEPAAFWGASGDGHADHQKTMIWQPEWLPPGFMPSEAAAVNSRSYTDGFAVLSIFVEPLINEVHRDIGMHRGASVSYSVGYADQKSLVTVVGEVPLDTAREVAHSLNWEAK